MAHKNGTFILLGMPIGNRLDFTLRIIQALKSGVHFYVEDTRSAKNIFHMLEIPLEQKQFYSYHDQSQLDDSKIQHIVQLLESGEDVYYFSQAGHPMICDPAYPLVKAILEKFSIDYYGCTDAVSTMLALSGLPLIPYTFWGFFPRTISKQLESLQRWIDCSSHTHIFFEGVSRVQSTITLLLQNLHDQGVEFNLCVGREFSKEFQSVYRFHSGVSLENQLNLLKDIIYRGEFTLALNIHSQDNKSNTIVYSGKVRELIEQVKNDGPKGKSVAKLLALLSGENAKELYQKWTKSDRVNHGDD